MYLFLRVFFIKYSKCCWINDFNFICVLRCSVVVFTTIGIIVYTVTKNNEIMQLTRENLC